MTPALVERAQICDASWNEHILKSLQCVIYAQTFYLDIVCENWKALVWPSLQDFEIVMPLPVRRKFGVTIIYQPHFCQFLGLFSTRPLTEFQLESFLRFISIEFSYISAYHFNPENSIRMSALAVPDFEFKAMHTHWLKTNRSYQQLQADYSNDRKRNLRLGIAHNWQILESEDINPLISLFRDNHVKNIAGGVDPAAFVTLEALFKALYARGNALLFYACLNDCIHAGIMLVQAKGRTIYLFNAADRIGRAGNARTVLLDNYFKNNDNQSLIFDFESPDVKSIASFYRSFGSTPTLFYSMSKNELPFPLKHIQNWRKLLLRTTQDLF